MLRRLMLALIAIAASSGAAGFAEAKPDKGDKWVKLDSREIVLSLDKDRFELAKAQGSFKAIRLEAKRNGIELTRVAITYAGGVQNEQRTIKLKKGERTKEIQLGGQERFLDAVDLAFTPDKSAKGSTTLEIWGLQSAAGLSAVRPEIANAPTKGPPGTVTAGGDVLFGAQDVGFGRDRDQITVGGEIGKFDRIRLRILENDVFISALKVVYLDGTSTDVAIDEEVKQNARTKWFDIKGDRFIKSIEMIYRSKPSFKGQARVEVFGEYANGWLGPKGEGRKYNQGWVLLGSQTAGFIGFDNDIMSVGKNEGGFKRIRVTVKDRAITLSEIRVVYANGADETFQIKSAVASGATYGPLDLKKGSGPIKEIRGVYRSRFLDQTALGKGNAIVEIWGQH